VNEMVEKKQVYFDRTEIPGLVNVSEIVEEKRSVEVPGFNVIRDVQSGITKQPQITLTYKLERGTNTLRFFEDFFTNNETKDMTIVRTDAHGMEFDRKTYTQCEVLSKTAPEYNAESPNFASIAVVILIHDIIPV